MQAYSMDFRQRVIELYDEGMQTAEVAEVMGCCKPWARKLKQRLRETGSIAPMTPVRKSQRVYDQGDEMKIEALLAQRPDATLREIIDHIGKKISLGNACRALARMGLKRKKSPRTPANRTVRT
jgi:transposase